MYILIQGTRWTWIDVKPRSQGGLHVLGKALQQQNTQLIKGL